jgi:hypothetical protein
MRALGHLLDLPKDRSLTRALPHQLSESPLGETDPEPGMVGVAPESPLLLRDSIGMYPQNFRED